MYNLTNNQKKTAKWLVEKVRQEKLDEEFKIMWFTALQPSDSQLRLFNRQGQEYSIIIKISDAVLTQGSLEALSQNGLLTYKEIELPPYETWHCNLTDAIYTAVDNDFKNLSLPKSPMYKQNPWISGSFYLVALVVILVVFAVISAYIPLYIIPILLIAAIIALGVIGAFQLRMDGELNESNFLTLMIETYKRLPLLIQDKTKPPSEK